MRLTRRRLTAAMAGLACVLPAIAATASTSTPAVGPVAVTAPGCPAPSPGLHTSAPGAGKTVALTFDDGPGPSTAATLAVLRKYGVRATFFDVGEHMQAHPDLVRETVAEGHLLGNHTWDHPHMATLTAPAQGAEMDATTTEQIADVGAAPCVFRPPYGNYDADTIAQANARGMTVWNWNITTTDWAADASTSTAWVNRIVRRAEAGAKLAHPVILMHNGPAPGDPPAAAGGDPATVKALPTIIAFYRKHGYAFVDLLGHRGYAPYAPTGAPAAAATTTAAGLHVFARDRAGSVVERTLHAGAWGALRSLGGQTPAGVAATAVNMRTSLVAVTGADGRVRVRTVGDRATGAWTSLDGNAVGRPAITTDPATGVVTVVVRTRTGALAFRQRVHGRWRAWTSLGGRFVTSPSVATTCDHRLTVVAATADGRMWLRSHGRSWSAWHTLTAVTSADPALTTTADRAHLVLLLRTATGTVDRRVGNAGGTTWSAARSLGGVAVSGPAAVTRDGHLYAVTVSTTGALVTTHATSTSSTLSGWTGWSRLPLTSG